MREVVQPVVSLKYLIPSHAALIAIRNPLEKRRVLGPATRCADIVHTVQGVEFVGRHNHPPVGVGGKIEVQA